MCGIYAYFGTKNASQQVVNGLKRLDYRGYDSWGVAVTNNQKITIKKQVGKIETVKSLDLPKTQIALGHTRWATHGGITKTNAHPHLSSTDNFALVHNGIVENHQALKDQLSQQGYKFKTQTDTETIVAQIEQNLTKHDFAEAVRLAFLVLEGRNAVGVLSKTGQLVCARSGSPLVVGLGNNQTIISSDVLSFAGLATHTIQIQDQEILILDKKLTIHQVENGQQIKRSSQPLSIKVESTSKNGYDHYMIKEIMDTPQTLLAVAAGQKSKLNQLVKQIKSASNVYVIGSGTAGLAAAQIAYDLRSISHISATSLVGAEAAEYLPLFTSKDLIIAPSQSGETADVLEILEHAKTIGVKIATYVNMPGSTMTRIADYSFMAGAGPEICVMSTKIFTSQIAWGYRLAQAVAGNTITVDQALTNTASVVGKWLAKKSTRQSIQKLAHQLSKLDHLYLIAKGQLLQIAREGMVKLIEGSYLHAHAIPAGDLKHYAITLMQPGVVVLALVAEDDSKTGMQNAIAEVKARGATVITIGPKSSSTNLDLKLPEMPMPSIAHTIALQILAYELAKTLGHNIDKPRNIAKSVTVK